MTATPLESVPWIIPKHNRCFWCEVEGPINSLHFYLPGDNPIETVVFQLCEKCETTVPGWKFLKKIECQRSSQHEVTRLDDDLREIGREQYYGKTRLSEN